METLLRYLSIAFGLALAVIVLIYNWISASWWPFIVGDSASVPLLLYGAFFSPRVLAAGWGFACANFYRALFISWGTSGLSWVVVGLTALLGMTLVGLAITLISAVRSRCIEERHGPVPLPRRPPGV